MTLEVIYKRLAQLYSLLEFIQRYRAEPTQANEDAVLNMANKVLRDAAKDVGSLEDTVLQLVNALRSQEFALSEKRSVQAALALPVNPGQRERRGHGGPSR